jgi:hypothetical protein
LLAEGPDYIIVSLKGKIVRNILKNKEQVGKMKLTITNFQKNDSTVRISDRTSCELDTEVCIS